MKIKLLVCSVYLGSKLRVFGADNNLHDEARRKLLRYDSVYAVPTNDPAQGQTAVLHHSSRSRDVTYVTGPVQSFYYYSVL